MTRNVGTVTAKAYDLWYDATAVGANEEVPMSARVLRRDGDRVAVQVELPTATNAVT